jgi:hypothetical protein
MDVTEGDLLVDTAGIHFRVKEVLPTSVCLIRIDGSAHPELSEWEKDVRTEHMAKEYKKVER